LIGLSPFVKKRAAAIKVTQGQILFMIQSFILSRIAIRDNSCNEQQRKCFLLWKYINTRQRINKRLIVRISWAGGVVGRSVWPYIFIEIHYLNKNRASAPTATGSAHLGIKLSVAGIVIGVPAPALVVDTFQNSGLCSA